MRDRWLILLLVSFAGGCAPSAVLTFPRQPLNDAGDHVWYDVSRDGRGDFALRRDAATARIDAVCYDDDEDGLVDRAYKLADYAGGRVPHLIVLLDSVPYAAVDARYQAGDFRWFEPPRKVIAPFPSLTEVCFTALLHAPPLPGMIDQYVHPTAGRRNGLWRRATGYRQPWERRLHYHSGFAEQGLVYLNPRPWLAAEMERVRRALDANPGRVTLAYVTSASGMLCKYGADGCRDVLDAARQLCLQVLYERQGAVKITLVADHGHNFAPSENVRLDEVLAAAGFNVGGRVRGDRDVAVEINGLVTYAGVHTRKPSAVADACLARKEVELATYVEGEAVVVRSAAGRAVLECAAGRVRYRPDPADVLGYGDVIARMKAAGRMSAAGFADDAAWLEFTHDHAWPDAPRRLWDAFHGTAATTPTVMLSLRDGYCAGLAKFARMVRMASSHGGLNQANSAAFVMTMTAPGTTPVRTRDVMRTVEPEYKFDVKR
jgi:hypothetical protein